MSPGSRINVTKSIRQHKLVMNEDWSDKHERFVVYLFCGLLILFPLLFLPVVDFSNPGYRLFFLTITPFFFLFSVFVIYRKAREKYLISVSTPLEKKQSRKLLLKYARQSNFDVTRDSSGCLIFVDHYVNPNPWSKNHIVILLTEDSVLFTILQEGSNLSLPAMTSPIFLKKNLKKILRSS